MLTSWSFPSTFGNNDQNDFRVVSGILRLATKYIIDSLREKALAHLSIAWPLTLKAWDAREDFARSHGMSGGQYYPHPVVRLFLYGRIRVTSNPFIGSNQPSQRS